MNQFKDRKVNLKQFKGHHRRFPWAMLVRVLVACASIGMIWFLMDWTKELSDKNAVEEKDYSIEIEYNP